MTEQLSLSKTTGAYGKYIFTGKKLLNYFTECLYYFTDLYYLFIPEAIYASSRSSTSLSELGTTSIFNFIHFKRSIVVSHPGLNLHFPIG